jgi:DivIVA domain-containing protein
MAHNLPVTTRAAELPDPDFPTTRWGARGYRCEEVDSFLEGVRRAMRSDPPGMAPYEVVDQRFPGVRFRRGYAMQPVDEYLDTAQRTLRERHGEDAVADIPGHATEPRHFPTWWIYLVAAVLVVAIVVFAVTQL